MLGISGMQLFREHYFFSDKLPTIPRISRTLVWKRTGMSQERRKYHQKKSDVANEALDVN